MNWAILAVSSESFRLERIRLSENDATGAIILRYSFTLFQYPKPFSNITRLILAYGPSHAELSTLSLYQ